MLYLNLQKIEEKLPEQMREMGTSPSDGWSVNDRGHMLKLVHQNPVEEKQNKSFNTVVLVIRRPLIYEVKIIPGLVKHATPLFRMFLRNCA